MKHFNANIFKAAENLSNELVIELGKSLYEGTNGYAEDKKTAKDLLSGISLKGDSEAQYLLYKMYDIEENKEEAIKWLKMSAEQRHADAALALLYENMEGNIESINEETIDTIVEAANNQHPNAMYILSEFYDHGEYGIEKDHEMVKTYCKMSAELGSSLSQYKMYKYLISEDRDAALKWLKKAAQNDDKDAQYQLWQELSSEAFNWLEEAYAKEHPYALFDFARLQETDVFMKKDFQEAKDTYKILSLMDIEEAAVRLIR